MRLYRVCVCVCLTYYCSFPFSVSYVEQQGWWLQKKIMTYGARVIVTHSLFEPLVPYFTICVVYHVSVVASGRNQPSTPVRVSDRKSKFRLWVPRFCRFSTQPLSANAIMPFIDFSTVSQQPTHIQFSNNARINVIFCDYRCGGTVIWGAAEYRLLSRRMHNHSKQCPKGNYGFYITVSLLSLCHFWSFLQSVGL